MRIALLAVLAVLAVAGCNRRDVVLFDGMQFNARLESTRDNRRDFTVTVQGAAANVPAALQAGAYEATQHCLARFGDSRVVWVTGPDQLPAQVALTADGATLMQGSCAAR